MTQLKEIILGSKYGKWTIVHLMPKRGHNRRVWCRCDCGLEREVILGSLLSGKSGSCGLRGCRNGNVLPRGVASFNFLFLQYQHAAKSRGYDWKLTKEEFLLLTGLSCHYCGAIPNQESKSYGNNSFNGNYVYNGVDRKDNSVGYTVDNCVPCCGLCNQKKWRTSYEEFVAWVHRVSQHLRIVS